MCCYISCTHRMIEFQTPSKKFHHCLRLTASTGVDKDSNSIIQCLCLSHTVKHGALANQILYRYQQCHICIMSRTITPQALTGKGNPSSDFLVRHNTLELLCCLVIRKGYWVHTLAPPESPHFITTLSPLFECLAGFPRISSASPCAS